jgi:pilus assembly protein Flp/PilA
MLWQPETADPCRCQESAVASSEESLGELMLKFMQRLVNRRDDQNGASAVEYGLLVAAIAAIIVLIVFAIGKFVKTGFKDTCSGLASGSYSATPTTCPS